MKKYDIFLFDADGTLFDYDRAEENALGTMFKTSGYGYSENIRSLYREINSDVWQSYERGEVSKDQLQTLRFARLFKKLGIDWDAGDFNKNYLNELGKGSFLIDGALEICRAVAAAGKKLFIVTNGILATQKSRMEHSAIREYISDYFVSEHVGFQKPQKEFFDYVLSHIPAIAREKILIIGDSLTADIAGGNNAGIDSCWFNRTGDANSSGIVPVYQIRLLSELEKFIN